MPVNRQLKCLFIHIPKTGGTSIEAALGMHGDLDYIGISPYIKQKRDIDNVFGKGLQHLTAIELKQSAMVEFGEYFSFSFVRNPFDRIVSTMAFSGALDAMPEILEVEYFRENLVKKIDSKELYFRPQHEFIYHNAKLQVDFVGRYETLEVDFLNICDKLKLRVNLEQRMKSRHKHYTEYYDDKTRNIVKKKYAKDIEYFGYKF